ncbi:MAG: MiaB/RimO family radical SAM methylthiotransferase [Phycisphaerales bacterium]
MPRVYLETFGCQMNELDSQLVSSQLRTLGYTFTPESDQADVVLYNTCSVREHAEQKVWSRLGELALRKARQPALVVGVLGCMAEREGEALIKRMPVVDVLIGPAELDKLPGLLDNALRTRASLLSDESVQELAATPEDEKPDVSRLRSARQVALHGAGSHGTTNRRSSTLAAAADSLELLDLSRATSPDDHQGSAYVRITRGCNKFCTYCVVPFTRGAEVHRPPEHIIDECKRLADAGVIEVTLLGQTVNLSRFEHDHAVTIDGVIQPQKGRAYTHKHGIHHDPYKLEKGEHVTSFADLLHRIHEQVPAIKRLRFVTSFPRSFGDDILQVMRDCPRICRYLHVPAQSGSDTMLRAMNRGYTVGEYLEFIDRARSFLHQPEIGRPLTLAGDIIVGFPGETDADHQATADLLRRVRYKNCFIFKYSPRPGTIAEKNLVDDVPDEVKRRRNNELLAIQNTISDEVSRSFVGQTLDVFVQGLSRKEQKAARKVDASGACSTSPGGVALTVGGVALSARGKAETSTDAAAMPSVGADAGGAAERRGAVQLQGRTEGDLIVLFEPPTGVAPDSMLGQIVRTRIDHASALSLFGIVV